MVRKGIVAITYLYISESSGIVPLKVWKHSGGIATSQYILICKNLNVIDGTPYEIERLMYGVEEGKW